MNNNPYRQTTIIAAIINYTREQGYPPTYLDICEAVGITMSTLRGHLERMREAGLVDWRDKVPRSIKVIDGSMGS